MHSGDEWVFCVPWHQQYWSGRGINFFLGRSDSSSEVVSSSDFRFDRFDFLFRFERFFSVFSLGSDLSGIHVQEDVVTGLAIDLGRQTIGFCRVVVGHYIR